MALISDSKEYPSNETVCNNSTRNCVVREFLIKGKAGYQISITKLGIDLANEKDGVISTCYVTVEADKNEKQLAKWSNSKDDYTPRSASVDYKAPAGYDAKIRVYLKTDDKNFSALVKNFLGAWEYTSAEEDETPEDGEPEETDEPVEDVRYLIVKCNSENVDQVIEEIQKIAPDAKISKLA